MRKFIVQAWNFIFNHDVSPLRHIPDVAIRHYVFQALGLMWAVSFALAIGSYTFLAASVIGHVVLIAAAAITKFLSKLINVISSKSKIFLIISTKIPEVLNQMKVLKKNIVVYEFVPQISLLPFVDLFVNHGGLNSIKESLVLNSQEQIKILLLL